MYDLHHLSVGAGVLVGVIHALSGPDHLAAMATLSTASPWGKWRSGLAWGFGHALGTWGIAALLLLGRDIVPLPLLSASAERLVGVTLILLGLWGLRKAIRRHLHNHTHSHGGVLHGHYHVHRLYSGTHDSSLHADHRHACVGLGALHGFAGGGAIFAALPLLGLSMGDAIRYLAAFGVGGMTAMAIFTWIWGKIGNLLSAKKAVIASLMLGASASVSIFLGGIWVFK
jgi:hypothetical protein